MEDKEILDRIKQGDESALDYLYRKHYKMMVKLIVRNSGSTDEAQDVYQDALIVFWEKAVSGNLVLTSKISTYLYSICQNLWRKELDRKSRHSVNAEINLETPDEFEPDKQERIDIVNRCIESLADGCRQILMYYYFDKLSMTEIADKMGLANADTAKTKKYKCKHELDLAIKSLYKPNDFLD